MTIRFPRNAGFMAAHALRSTTRMLVGAAALAFLLAPLDGAAIPEPDDLAGPPPFSINGCPHDKDWTNAVVAEALGVANRTIERLQQRHGLSNLRLCTTPYVEIAGRVENSRHPKHRADQPDKAARFRALTQASDDGAIKDDGLYQAFLQREEIVAKSRAKAGGITSLSWLNIGPPAAGGRVRAILAPHASATPATRMLVGSVSGGIWKTEDAGTTWAPVNDFMLNVAIACLVRDPLVPNTVYACTGEIFAGDGVRGFGILKSIDNGSNWSLVSSTNPTTAPVGGTDWYYVNRLAIQPGNSGVMLAATGGGVYRTPDAGASWTRVLGDIPSFGNRRRLGDVKFHPLDANKVLVGELAYFDPTLGATNGGGVWFSNDAGLTFARVALGGISRVEVAPVAGVAGRWLAVPNVNSGELWQITEQPSPTPWSAVKLSTPAHLGAQGSYDNLLWASSDGARVIVGGVPIKFSDTGGTSWSASLPGIHVDHHIAVTDAASSTVFFGNDGGMYKSTNALTATIAAPPTFTNINNGFVITQFYGGSGRASASARVTGGTQDNGTWTFDGASWTRTFGSDGGEGEVDPFDPNFLYGEVQNLGLFRSTDGGGSANYICSGITDSDCAFSNPNSKTNFIAPIALDQANPNRMLAGGESLWRSENVKAATPVWAAIKGPQPNQFTGSTSTYISAITIAPGNSDLVYLGYNDGQLWRSTNATASTPTWARVTFTGITNPTRFITAVLVDPQAAGTVYVTFGGYNTGNVVNTTNAGGNWTNLHPSALTLPAVPIRTIARHPAVASILYAGTEVGVFVSEDGGGNWSATNDGPGTVSVESLFFVDSGTLIAATHGRGFFRATVNFVGSPGTIQFERAANYAIAGTNAALNVTRLGGGTGAASASYSTASGTATLGTDFTGASGPLSWAAGDVAMKPVTIAVAANSGEGYESFNVNLSSVTGALAGSPQSATVGILDAFVPTNAIPTGFTTPGLTGAWTVASDSVYEGGFSLKGDISPIMVTTKAVEFASLFSAGTIGFAVRPSTYSAHPVRFSIDGVELATWAGDGGWSVATFPITAGAHTLRWSIARQYNNSLGQNAGWIDAVTLPTVPANTIAFAEAATVVSEAVTGGNLTLRVVRSAGSSGNASVSYATAAGTATAGSDYTTSAGVVNFTGTETEKTISIPIANDGTAEAPETFTVTLSGATGATLGQPATVTVTITDPFPGVALPPGYVTSAGANAGWSVATDSFLDGPNSLKSNPIGNSQRADVETTVTTAAGTMYFARRVSSEPGYDYLRFYIDGVEQAAWSGEVAWGIVSFPVSAGSHTFRWSYQKDNTAIAGSDAAWIDMVVFPMTAPTFTLTVSKSGSGTVTSSPVGIDCGSTCAFSFASGTMVTLAPAPAGGSAFGAWSGDCTGTGGCTVTLSAARNVGASFVLQGALLLTANPTSLDFGGQSMNTTSPSRSSTITNTSGSSVTVTGVTASSGYAVTHNCATLAAAATCTVNATFTPPAAPAAGPLPGSISITYAGGGPTTVSLTGTAEKSLVTHYYRSILRRAPDAPGKAFWESEATRLQNIGANINEAWFAMAQFFYFSAEYVAFNRTNSEFVTDLYTTFFNRGPDGPGLSYWTGQIGQGMPREVVLASFMFSTEFVNFTQAIFGNTAARAEVDTVLDFYRGLLARLPDQGGYDFWVQQFRTAQCTGGGGAAGAVYTQVESISSQFANGAEYTGKNRTNAQYVGDLYNSFLRRGGDLAGVQFWITQINNAALTRNQVRQQFIASGEFNGRVTNIINQGCLP